MMNTDMECIVPYEEFLTIGDHIILELKDNDIFEGDFLEGGKDRIDIINTKQHNNPNDVLSGTYTFYRGEVKGISKFTGGHNQGQTTTGHSELKIVNMTHKEYDRLKDLIKNYVYLDKADKRYYDAIEKLKRVDNVGIVSLGLGGIIKLFVVCSWQQIYLFDLQELKNNFFYPELKEILESKYTCKIMHNAGPIVDILFRNYKIYCQNIFDTQVVDLIYRKNRLKGKEKYELQANSIEECLVRYFNFPAALFIDATAVPRKKWCEKPVNDLQKIFASQLCVYLIPLKGRLQKILFSRLYTAIDSVHHYYQNFSDTEYCHQINDSTIGPEVEKLIPNLKTCNNSNTCVNLSISKV